MGVQTWSNPNKDPFGKRTDLHSVEHKEQVPRVEHSQIAIWICKKQIRRGRDKLDWAGEQDLSANIEVPSPVSMQCQIQTRVDEACPPGPRGHSFTTQVQNKWGKQIVGPGQCIPSGQYESPDSGNIGYKMIMRGMYFGIVLTNEVAV